MKSNLLTLYLCLGAAAAKNVFQGLQVNDVDSLEKELELNKRDGKNVVSLELDEADLGWLKKEKRGEKHDPLWPSRVDKRGEEHDDLWASRVKRDEEHDALWASRVKRGEEHDDLWASRVKRDGKAYLGLQIPLEGPQPELEDALMPDAKTSNLATALTQIQDVSIFSSYIRDMVDLYQKCDDTTQFNINSQSDNMLLIFAPTNEAIAELSEKPWQFPRPVTRESDADDEASSYNIRHFVESHVVQSSNVADFAKAEAVLESLNGNRIHLRNSGTSFELSLDDVDEWLPIRKIELTANGALLLIDKTLSWPHRG
ncbi:hypothetical protein KL918_004848 [Ogataea parapolymorpha]|uniref:FAS1 domain-containing protein n=1 Tax=Ogataea parapolymorpha (strain ATCC 26012 / BCRC 20466 / JCM 22074 / NRRL Y-7560 / DL-1) TaxID=871575 RepID=W1QHP7_OGAPD|nr:FAS1 domain-containing protein [Ogataea parapolymorpha DL-1]ESX01875.1 FAS1 domain-containing protein [Ogataea parapolymorpha DL-1]KAG7865266.1 hypothetical protein KL918_004848 [Ogataea parapolymorpha]KAG7872851.1 hypothetical protein KL916_002896 [Ogataea parapolymorpha]